MDTSRVSRRLAIFVVAIGWACRWTAAHEPPAEAVPAPRPVPAIERMLPPPLGHPQLQPGEAADVLLEIREHLGPSILEGTMFQIGGDPFAFAWVLGPDQPDADMERMAFIEYIRALAAEEPMTCPLTGQTCSHSTAVCASESVAANGATCASCAHQATILASHASMQTAATVSALRGAARQLEMAAGDIEDHAQMGTIEAAELAWKQSDELREIARGLREKANGTFDELASHYHQTSVSQQSGSTCCAEQCPTTAAQPSVAGNSKSCGPDCEHQVAKTKAVAAQSACGAAQTTCSGVPIISKLPYLGRLFTRVDVESCEAKAPHEFGVPIAPGSRLFTAVRVAPPTHAAEPTAAELEAAINHLADELNELRNQLRLQTSRRGAAEQARQQ